MIITVTDVILSVLLAVIVVYIWFNNGFNDCKYETIKDTNSLIYISPQSAGLWDYQFNNNPINIKRYDSNDWLGRVLENKGKFEKFIHPNFGIRASIKIILSNIRSTNNVKEFVYRIATEGEHERYKAHIVKYIKELELTLGYKGKIREKDVIKVLRTMILLENGAGAVSYFNRYMECKQLEKFI